MTESYLWFLKIYHDPLKKKFTVDISPLWVAPEVSFHAFKFIGWFHLVSFTITISRDIDRDNDM
jgi:hypothetical protein